MKKEKKVYTPEELVIRKAQRKELNRLGFKEGIVPFLIHFAIVVAFIFFFVFVIANDANAHVPNVPDEVIGGVVVNDPNFIRLIYMILCFPAIFFLVKWAGKIQDKKKAFWPALIAGILLWQAIGECSHHFGLYVQGTFVFFPSIEGPQGLFLVLFIVPVLMIANSKKAFSWSIAIFLLSFMTNWICSFLLLGIAPIFSVDASYFNPSKWPKFAGIVFGMHGTMMLVYRILFKAKTTEERLALSILLYGFLGVFIEGVFQAGGSLE
jgi:hypothetical protein